MASTSLREARIDLDALRANLEVLGDGYEVDLSADAYGHGFEAIARTAAESGVLRFVVRDDAEGHRLRGLVDSAIVRVGLEAADGAAAEAGSRDRPSPAAVYGVADADGPTGLAPVMRVSARVISVKRLDSGDPVSYGYTWRAARPTTVALVGLGYADGVSRRASNRSTAWLRGPRPIVGRIAMDVLSLDVGDDPVEVGDRAVLFGANGVSAADWARPLGVPVLSVTAGIGPRVPRVYLGSGAGRLAGGANR